MQQSSAMQAMNANVHKYMTKEEATDNSQQLLGSDALQASDLFSKDTAANERQLSLLRQRELNRQMKDQGSIKIQQLFQETKDLNEKLFGPPAAKKNNYFNVNERSLSSKSSNQDYSPVRRPHSRSRSRGAGTSQSRGQAAGRSAGRSAKSDKDSESLNWPQ